MSEIENMKNTFASSTVTFGGVGGDRTFAENIAGKFGMIAKTVEMAQAQRPPVTHSHGPSR